VLTSHPIAAVHREVPNSDFSTICNNGFD